MAIVDARTPITTAESTTNWEDTSGGGAGNLNSDTFAQGSNSISDKVSNALDGLHYNHGGSTWSAGEHLYIWYNFLFGAIETKANGGIRVRISNATSPTNWRDLFIDGSDTYSGGWKLAVVSIDRILGRPDAENGGNIDQYADIGRIGIMANVTSMVGGNNDNLAVDAIYQLPASTPSIRVQGEDTGSVPFTWNSVVDFSESNGLGLADRSAGGIIRLAGPIEFGQDNASADTFDSSGDVISWQSQEFVAHDFFKLSGIAGTGTTRITAGSKLGSGVSALGVNGWTIVSAQNRWSMDFSDPDINDVQLYGCSFNFGGPDWDIDDPAVEIISNTFTNCQTIQMTGDDGGAAIGPTILNSFFVSNPGPGAQVKLLDNPSSGQFDGNFLANTDWFALEIPTGSVAGKDYDLRNITFSGNGTDRDILLSHPEDDVQINVVGGTTPGVTNGSTFTISFLGGNDIFVTVATFDDVDQTTPIGDTGTDLIDSSGDLTVTETINTNATAVALMSGDYASIGPTFLPDDDLPSQTWGSDFTRQRSGHFPGRAAQGDGGDITNGFLWGSMMDSSLLGDGLTGSRTASTDFTEFNTSGFPNDPVLAVAEILPAATTTPTVMDPDGKFRPTELARDSSSFSFGYGITDPTEADERLMVIMVANLVNVGTDNDSPSFTWGAPGTDITADVRVSATPISGLVEARILSLDSADIEQGTFDINVSVTLTVTVVDESNTPIENARVAIYSDPEGPAETQLMNELTDASGIATEVVNFISDTDVSVRVRKGSSTDTPKYQPINSNQTITSDGLTVTITMTEDPINNA